MNPIPQMTVDRLARRMRSGDLPDVLLDVRNPPEWEIGRIEGARLLPLGEFATRADELDPASEIVVYCHRGGRSARAVAWLRARGFTRAINLAGGIDAWSLEVDPAVPRY